MRASVTLALLLALAWPMIQAQPTGKRAAPKQHFVYDSADSTVPATMLDGVELYDPGLASVGDKLWLTWLKFIPGKGDEMHVGLRDADGWTLEKTVSATPGRYARPTLTAGAGGTLWLSYEASDDDKWDIVLRQHLGAGHFAGPLRVSQGEDNAINHRVCPDLTGVLWVVWQGDC